MNRHTFLGALAITTISLLSRTHASTILAGDPVPGGINYSWSVSLGAADNAFVSGHVGPWSWEDEELGVPDTGWAHESHWIGITLLEASDLTLLISAKADVPDPGQAGGLAGGNLFPGVTIWSGLDNDGSMSHSYFNKGNVSWAEDLTYLAHIPGGSGNSISGTWTLPAGQYTFALGGNSTSLGSEPRQGYGATFTTTPVPEPSSALLVSIASMALLLRRKR